ncbi:MAG: hypothetical protein JW938_02155 [Candidatus Omnitrophica bacterium]|nr:hypothetical protein [Candidatus Omnitrophota bacterium]
MNDFHKRSKRWLCIWLLIISVAFSSNTVQAQEPALADAPFLYRVEFPEEIGSVEQRWEGTSPKTIILIQDSHISLEVQLNISKIIETLVKEYNVGLVNIEGADHEKIDFEELRQLEPRDVVERVSIEFLKESRINGAVYAKINCDKDFKQYGTEDKDKYLENYKYYLSVIEHNQQLADFILNVRNQLMKNKQKFLSQKLIEFINVEILFRDGDTSLISYFKILIKNANELGIDLIQYPSITQMVEIALSEEQSEMFKSVDNEGLLNELAQLSKAIIDQMATTPRAQQFVELLNKIMRLQDMLRLRVLPDDYEDYLQNESEFQEARVSSLIKALFPDMDMTPLIGLNELLKNMDFFYQKAHERSRVIFKNSLKNMETEGTDISVIVSGGFHTNELVNLCKENDISYIRVMPKVTSTESTVDYEGRMLELKAELIQDEDEE